MDQIVELQEENVRLRKAVDELAILNDLAKTIGGSRSTQEIIESITRRAMRAVQAEQSVVTLIETQTDDMMRTLVRTSEVSGEYEKFHMNQNVVGWMHLNKKPLLVNNPVDDDRFAKSTWGDSIKNVLCVPLMIKSELRGILSAYNKKGDGQFTSDDQRLLTIIASQSAQVIENARLYEQEKMLLGMQEQLKLAAKIQNDLFPKSSPIVPGYEIVGKSIPAQVVGGDYFDFISIDDNRIAVVLGDVTGKGLPASLLMANVQATLRGQALFFTSTKQCINHANLLLHKSTSSDKFVTIFYGVLDFTQHRFSYCNAGHDNPFLLSSKSGEKRLEVGGVPVGVMKGFDYEDEEISFEEGDTFVMYSDGITEAMSKDGKQFGEEQLKQVLDTHFTKPAGELLEEILLAVKAHTVDAVQSDDITVVIVKRLSK